MSGGSEAGILGAFWVEFLPILKYVPSWFPGAGFQRKAAVTIILLTFPHSFSSYTLCMLLRHAYYFLFTFLFPSTDFLFFHVQPYCLCIASGTVRLLMHSPAQSAY